MPSINDLIGDLHPGDPHEPGRGAPRGLKGEDAPRVLHHQLVDLLPGWGGYLGEGDGYIKGALVWRESEVSVTGLQTVTGRSLTSTPSLSVAPITRPPWMPPPASMALQARG